MSSPPFFILGPIRRFLRFHDAHNAGRTFLRFTTPSEVTRSSAATGRLSNASAALFRQSHSSFSKAFVATFFFFFLSSNADFKAGRKAPIGGPMARPHEAIIYGWHRHSRLSPISSLSASPSWLSFSRWSQTWIPDDLQIQPPRSSPIFFFLHFAPRSAPTRPAIA